MHARFAAIDDHPSFASGACGLTGAAGPREQGMTIVDALCADALRTFIRRSAGSADGISRQPRAERERYAAVWRRTAWRARGGMLVASTFTVHGENGVEATS